MSDTTLALLKRLAEIKPDRFSMDGDQFADKFGGFMTASAFVLNAWLFKMMNELGFAAIWKQEDRTWEESVLNAIVHHFEREAYKEEIKIANDGMCGSAE